MNKSTKIFIIGALISVISAGLWKLNFVEEPTSTLISSIVTLIVTYFAHKAEKEQQIESKEPEKFNNSSQADNSKKVTITNTNINTTSGNVIITGGDSTTINSK